MKFVVSILSLAQLHHLDGLITDTVATTGITEQAYQVLLPPVPGVTPSSITPPPAPHRPLSSPAHLNEQIFRKVAAAARCSHN